MSRKRDKRGRVNEFVYVPRRDDEANENARYVDSTVLLLGTKDAGK